MDNNILIEVVLLYKRETAEELYPGATGVFARTEIPWRLEELEQRTRLMLPPDGEQLSFDTGAAIQVVLNKSGMPGNDVTAKLGIPDTVIFLGYKENTNG